MKKFSIFIADGSPDARQFIRFTIQSRIPNTEITLASNGKYVQGRLEQGTCNLIIYESEMPLLSGEKFLDWVKGHALLKNIPVIIITSDRRQETLSRYIRLGADEFLLKPLLADELVKKVAEFAKNGN